MSSLFARGIELTQEWASKEQQLRYDRRMAEAEILHECREQLWKIVLNTESQEPPLNKPQDRR